MVAVPAWRHEARERSDDLVEHFARLVRSLDPQTVLESAARELVRRSGLPVALVGHSAAADRLVISATDGTTSEAFRGLVVPAGCGLGGKVVAMGKAQVTVDYLSNPSITHDFDAPVAAEALRAMVAVPIRSSRRFHGVLYGAARRAGPLGDDAADAITEIADHAGVALDVAERAGQATEVAVHEERRRLAIGLHDSVGALLYAISASARQLATAVDGLGDVAEQARDIDDRAASAAVALRRALRTLHATPEELALSVELSADCKAFEARTGTTAHLMILTDLPVLSAERTGSLVAGVREALVNVEKHAAAATVVVTVAARDGGVMIAVADDGTGLEGAEIPGLTAATSRDVPVRPAAGEGAGSRARAHSTGLGLEAAAVRLARVGGWLHLGANDDGGVTTRMWVPC
jgi:LuxR family transcriptional regulator, regulator of acetate metabolism